MKLVVGMLVLFGISLGAQADIQIKFRDASGATSTMVSNGDMVRINSRQTPGYVLLDGPGGVFYLVDEQRGEVGKISADEIRGVPPDGGLSVSLKPRGSGDEVAGFKTGRFDLIANGLYCGTLNGSSELIKSPELKRMLEGMQNLHKLTRARLASLAGLSECQQASSQLADLVETSGFVLRYMDDQGKLMFEVLSLDPQARVADDYYDLPAGMPVIDLGEKMNQAAEQMQQMQESMPDMNALMKQIEDSGGELDDDTRRQLEEMMKQMQQQAQ